MGRFVEPFFLPMGLEWRSGVSLIAGAAAKEVIASSMAVLNPPIPSAAAAFAMMLFILLYFPCISTLATIRKETSAGWMWFSMLFNTALAWVVATGFYQIALLF